MEFKDTNNVIQTFDLDILDEAILHEQYQMHGNGD